MVRKGDTIYAYDTKRDDKTSQNNGFEIVSQNGSLCKMKNSKTNLQTIIPYHSKSLKRLEQEVLKQAGLK